MSSPNTLSIENGQASEPALVNHIGLPTLTISDLPQNQVGPVLFSPASPISTPLHQNRIGELLFSPISPRSEPMKNATEYSMLPRPQSYSFQFSQSLPQSFDELHSERSYLISCLQAEDHKAAELLRMIAPLEERLAQQHEYFIQRRKIKKRLGWLRHRFDETRRQEKRILARLGQLSFEMQTRERWTQIDFERRQREVEQQQSYFNYQPEIYRVQQMSLGQESSNLTLQGYQASMPLDQSQQCPFPDTPQFGGFYWPAPKAQNSPMQIAELVETSPVSEEILPKDTSADDTPILLRPNSSHRSSSLNDTIELLEVLSTNSVLAAVPRVKRLSLPTLPLLGCWNIWSDTVVEEKDGVSPIQQGVENG